MLYELNLPTILVAALLGGLGAYLSNQGIAVFHDGIRPLIPQYKAGAMDGKTLFETSFGLSFGLIFVFGLPISLAGKIIVANTVLLATDLIGIYFLDKRKGKWLSAILGAIFAIILLFSLDLILNIFTLLPIDFTGDLRIMGSVVLLAIPVFPALAVAIELGVKRGGLVLLGSLLVRLITAKIGAISIATINIDPNPNALSLFFGIIVMVMMISKANRGKGQGSAGALEAFSHNIGQIKEHTLILALSGGLIALATSLLILAEGPASLFLTGEGEYFQGVLVALIRTLAFIPLVMTTSIISGVYSPAGTKAVHLVGILLINMGVLGLAGSFVLGALIIVGEIFLLATVSKKVDRIAGLKAIGDSGRTAISKLTDLSLLVGGILAAHSMAPGIGFFWVLGIYFLNENSEKPLPSTAIGPIAAISMGLIINILYLVGLDSIY